MKSGTAAACARLVEKLGGVVVRMIFPIELEGFKARGNALEAYAVESLVRYEGKSGKIERSFNTQHLYFKLKLTVKQKKLTMNKAIIAALAAGAAFVAQAESAVSVWGFGDYGINSGYQLYGSLLNSEPTMSGYQEINVNATVDDLDLGSLGFGIWSNTDLTDKRRGLYGKAFNEYDPNIHYTRTFWFDDDHTWGLDYRTEVVWYIYPHHRGHHAGNPAAGRGHYQSCVSTMTTMDWNHAFELKNPYVTPYFKWVHEYHENKANLFLGGLKKRVGLDEIAEGLAVTPLAELVYRSHRYNWCFPTAGWSEVHGSGMASLRLGADINYQLTAHFGLFAKVYWCHTIDKSLRSAAEHGYGNDYGQYKDFAWGGVGVTFNF